jgi:glycosyltransferase involved in cell wall biosynthesis
VRKLLLSIREMKKALIITYYWPPCGGSGVQRWMYFAKYLADFGIIPVVVTVDPKKASYKNFDYSLSDHVKGIRTYTTNTIEPLKLYSFLTTGSSNKGIPQGHVGTHKSGIMGRLFSFIRGNFFIPDARVGWNFYAERTALKVMREEGIDFVITTGPPHSTHLVGKKIKEKTGTTWIADFRDPWSELYYNKELLRTSWAMKKDMRLEKQVLEGANMVIAVGPSLQELLSDKVPDQKDKFHHIYNGYDKEAMDKAEVTRDDTFRICFIGQFGLSQPFEGLIKALELFCSTDGKDSKKINLCIAGNIDDVIMKLFQKLPNIRVEFYGRVGHQEALKLMKSSQLLLNSLAEVETSKTLISGKLMEYIASGNPILCIGDLEGDAARLLSSISNSKMFEKFDVDGMSRFIEKVYSDWVSGKPLINHSSGLIQNSRYETARLLASLLNKSKGYV